MPLLQSCSYLNHAAMSPLPLRVRRAMDRFLDRYLEEDLNREIDLSFGDDLRSAAADMLSCRVDEIAFVPSTSSGVSRAMKRRASRTLTIRKISLRERDRASAMDAVVMGARASASNSRTSRPFSRAGAL